METTSAVVTHERIGVQNGYMPATRAYGGVSAEERRAHRRARCWMQRSRSSAREDSVR